MVVQMESRFHSSVDLWGLLDSACRSVKVLSVQPQTLSQSPVL